MKRDISPQESPFHKDDLLSVSRKYQPIIRQHPLKDQIIQRVKKTILAGGDGIFERFSRSSKHDVIQRF